MTLLWLDDICEPDIKRVVKLGTVNFTKIVHVTTYGQFTDWITENGLPDFVSFDYDLSENPNLRWKTPLHSWYKLDQENSGRGGRPYNGYDAAKWLIKYCANTGTYLPYYNCHSQEPTEVLTITGILRRYIQTIEDDFVNKILARRKAPEANKYEGIT